MVLPLHIISLGLKKIRKRNIIDIMYTSSDVVKHMVRLKHILPVSLNLSISDETESSLRHLYIKKVSRCIYLDYWLNLLEVDKLYTCSFIVPWLHYISAYLYNLYVYKTYILFIYTQTCHAMSLYGTTCFFCFFFVFLQNVNIYI